MLEFELVLPCYNESKSLEKLIRRSREAALKSGFSPESFQLVLVENGSLDSSAGVLKLLEQGDLAPWFRVVPVKPNRGYGNGLWRGLQTCKARFVGWSHADQQCDPQDAFRAYTELQKLEHGTGGKFVVKGARHGRDPKDRFVSSVFEFLARIVLGQKLSEINAQPKVFRRELLEHLHNPPLNFAFDLYVLHRALAKSWSLREIPVHFPPRIHGVSNWAGSFFSRYRTILGMISYMLQLRRENQD
ncbi:MAG: glycosyltransferase family 2 protein [Bdellovibrio sp.]